MVVPAVVPVSHINFEIKLTQQSHSVISFYFFLLFFSFRSVSFDAIVVRRTFAATERVKKKRAKLREKKMFPFSKKFTKSNCIFSQFIALAKPPTQILPIVCKMNV